MDPVDDDDVRLVDNAKSNCSFVAPELSFLREFFVGPSFAATVTPPEAFDPISRQPKYAQFFLEEKHVENKDWI